MQVIVNRNDDEKEETHSICTYRIFFLIWRIVGLVKKKGVHKCNWGISLYPNSILVPLFPQTYVSLKGFREYFLVKQLYLICSEYNYKGEMDWLILMYVHVTL